MNCPSCGNPIRGRTLFCPSCGQKIHATGATATVAGDDGPFRLVEEGAEPQGCARSIFVLVTAAAAFLLIVLVGVAAVRMGLADRQYAVRQAALEHQAKGAGHLARAEYELAVAEFGMALQLDAGLAEAQAGLDVAQERLEGLPEPTSGADDEVSAGLLREITQAYERGDWPTVFATADRLLAANPTYHRQEVDAILFEALYQSGLLLVEQDRITEAMRMFDRALLIQPDEPRASHARDLASQYITALSYWERDWTMAISSLEWIHSQEPGYRDVAQRLGEALSAYAGQLGDAMDWCGAEEQYARAAELPGGEQAAQARDDAAVRCAQQTPTPAPDLTPDATTVATTPVPAGTFVGETVGYEEVGGQKMFIRGHVLNAQGQGMGGARVTIRAWDWSVTATSDGAGQFSFDGLANPVTYTITLEDYPCVPYDVPGEWGKLTWIQLRPEE